MVSNIDSNTPRYSTFYVLLRYGSLWRIWLRAIGHYSKVGDALWATAAKFMTRYGPVQRILLGAMVHCDEFDYVKWATAHYEALQ